MNEAERAMEEQAINASYAEEIARLFTVFVEEGNVERLARGLSNARLRRRAAVAVIKGDKP